MTFEEAMVLLKKADAYSKSEMDEAMKAVEDVLLRQELEEVEGEREKVFGPCRIIHVDPGKIMPIAADETVIYLGGNLVLVRTT